MPRKAQRDDSGGAGLAAPGCVVWAKLRGYPWWPCRVAPLAAVPEELAEIALTQHKPGAVVAVYFFGSHDYSLVPVEALRSLQDNWQALSRAGSGIRFARALREVRDPERNSPGSLLRALAGDNAENERTQRAYGAEGKGVAKKQELSDTSRETPQKPIRVPGAPLDTPTFLRLCRLRLQRIMLGPSVQSTEIPVAMRTIAALSRVPVTLEALAESQLGRVLRLARERDEVFGPSGEHSQLGSAVDALLGMWRSSLAEYAARIGI